MNSKNILRRHYSDVKAFHALNFFRKLKLSEEKKKFNELYYLFVSSTHDTLFLTGLFFVRTFSSNFKRTFLTFFRPYFTIVIDKEQLRKTKARKMIPALERNFNAANLRFKFSQNAHECKQKQKQKKIL